MTDSYVPGSLLWKMVFLVPLMAILGSFAVSAIPKIGPNIPFHKKYIKGKKVKLKFEPNALYCENTCIRYTSNNNPLNFPMWYFSLIFL